MRTRLGMTWPDMILIFFIIAAAAFLWFKDLSPSPEASLVKILYGRGLSKEASLSEDCRISVPGPLGDSIVQIRSGEVFMVSSPCSNKVCFHMGRISRPGESILCIPNRISVVIGEKSPGTDTIAY